MLINLFEELVKTKKYRKILESKVCVGVYDNVLIQVIGNGRFGDCDFKRQKSEISDRQLKQFYKFIDRVIKLTSGNNVVCEEVLLTTAFLLSKGNLNFTDLGVEGYYTDEKTGKIKYQLLLLGKKIQIEKKLIDENGCLYDNRNLTAVAKHGTLKIKIDRQEGVDRNRFIELYKDEKEGAFARTAEFKNSQLVFVYNILGQLIRDYYTQDKETFVLKDDNLVLKDDHWAENYREERDFLILNNFKKSGILKSQIKASAYLGKEKTFSLIKSSEVHHGRLYSQEEVISSEDEYNSQYVKHNAYNLECLF